MHYIVVVFNEVVDRLLARARLRRRWRGNGSATAARLIREQAGLTQAEMAEILRVDRSAVSRWEASVRTPRAAVLARYAEVLERLAQPAARGE